MRIQAKFTRDGDWWVAWTEDVPGAISDGATMAEARAKLLDAVRRMTPATARPAPSRVLVEELEVAEA
jgi:predicted RNase H-like HicB family nuclease